MPRKSLAHEVAVNVLVRRHDVIHSTGQFHPAKRMLKTPVRCSGIDQMPDGALMNVAKSLKRSRVEDPVFILVQMNELVERISNQCRAHFAPCAPSICSGPT